MIPPKNSHLFPYPKIGQLHGQEVPIIQQKSIFKALEVVDKSHQMLIS